jgi:hypothetical protein
MTPPNGTKAGKLRRMVITCAVIAGLAGFGVFAHRSTQAWQQDLDRGLQGVQQTR